MNKKKILIIDDDRDIVTVLSVILEEYNYSVHAAYSGMEGIRMTASHSPDLILLDYMLPDINGDEVSRKLRETFHERTVPIILISAAHNAAKVAEQAKMDGYIPKPFDIEELLQTIKKFLSP